MLVAERKQNNEGVKLTKIYFKLFCIFHNVSPVQQNDNLKKKENKQKLGTCHMPLGLFQLCLPAMNIPSPDSNITGWLACTCSFFQWNHTVYAFLHMATITQFYVCGIQHFIAM
jgi:hypothetical protein